ncbi:hypothetical protein Tco_0771070 [Tanacetum coccineum]|uniref:Uncharacterized protein n=1 Tax=Tanacetum coccineum TaxID=301880 RepID=A0ABQ4ZDZ3_9ASTR
MVNVMFLSPGISFGMWGKAIISATYLLGNGYPTKGRKIKQNVTKPTLGMKKMDKTKDNNVKVTPERSPKPEVIKSKKIQLYGPNLPNPKVV